MVLEQRLWDAANGAGWSCAAWWTSVAWARRLNRRRRRIARRARETVACCGSRICASGHTL